MKTLLPALLLTFLVSAQQQPQPPAVISPEVLPDHRIVFRILAPEATSVRLRAGDIPALAGTRGAPPPKGPEFVKNDKGIWEATLDAVDPGTYRYVFAVNGVNVMDPRNPSISQSNANAWSMVHVPGADFMDTQNVPHGAVAAVTYYSTALGRFRRMHVYTPPGYEAGTAQKYPVFYLLHGAGDCDESWTSVGRAGFILDNLIAAKKAVPMIVVMTAGHTSATGFNGRPPEPGEVRRDEFQEDFVLDVMPYVEKNYRTLNDRAHRAIAGLSMGGSQTLNVAFTHLDKFAYVSVFSSGILGANAEDWEKNHLAMLDNAALKKGLKQISFRTGSDDFLLANSKSTVELLKKHGFDATFQGSSGGHTWINWRNYLNEFAPQLFH